MIYVLSRIGLRESTHFARKSWELTQKYIGLLLADDMAGGSGCRHVPLSTDCPASRYEFFQEENTMKNNLKTLHKILITLAFMLMVVGAFRVLAMAQDHHDHEQEMKAPKTAQDHRARSEQYQKKAEEYRREAAAHRKMLVDYSKTVARNPKDTLENAYIKKMRIHCEKYSKAADALANEAEEMAKYHTMRAKEMEGK